MKALLASFIECSFRQLVEFIAFRNIGRVGILKQAFPAKYELAAGFYPWGRL